MRLAGQLMIRAQLRTVRHGHSCRFPPIVPPIAAKENRHIDIDAVDSAGFVVSGLIYVLEALSSRCVDYSDRRQHLAKVSCHFLLRQRTVVERIVDAKMRAEKEKDKVKQEELDRAAAGDGSGTAAGAGAASTTGSAPKRKRCNNCDGCRAKPCDSCK